MSRSHFRTSFRLAVVTLSVLAGCESSPAAPTAGVATPHGTPPVQSAPGVQNAQLLGRAWWNQPELVVALKLSDAQRTKMDGLLTQSAESQRAVQRPQGQHEKALEQALASGDWQSARREASAIRDGLVAIWAAQSTLKIDVLALLTPEQRQIVVAQYPLLLRQPSVFGVPRRPTPAAATPRA
ncbi:MAG: hypothetical protein ABSA52_02425 [Candidatus Binatia bacterium]